MCILWHRTHFQSGVCDLAVAGSQVADAKDAERGLAKFRELPRTASLLNMSVLTTLYYCCLYHYEAPEACIVFSIIAIFSSQSHRLEN